MNRFRATTESFKAMNTRANKTIAYINANGVNMICLGSDDSSIYLQFTLNGFDAVREYLDKWDSLAYFQLERINGFLGLGGDIAWTMQNLQRYLS
jgi:hypothetical protein